MERRRVERGSGQYSQWTRESAQSEGVAFVDVTNLAADIFEYRGAKAVKALFPRDPVHTNAEGADLKCPSGKSVSRGGTTRGWLERFRRRARALLSF
jgi:hypothetical protein